MAGSASEAEGLAFLQSLGAFWRPGSPPKVAGMVLPDGRVVEPCSELSPEEVALDALVREDAGDGDR